MSLPAQLQFALVYLLGVLKLAHVAAGAGVDTFGQDMIYNEVRVISLYCTASWN